MSERSEKSANQPCRRYSNIHGSGVNSVLSIPISAGCSEMINGLLAPTHSKPINLYTCANMSYSCLGPGLELAHNNHQVHKGRANIY